MVGFRSLKELYGYLILSKSHIYEYDYREVNLGDIYSRNLYIEDSRNHLCTQISYFNNGKIYVDFFYIFYSIAEHIEKFPQYLRTLLKFYNENLYDHWDLKFVLDQLPYKFSLEALIGSECRIVIENQHRASIFNGVNTIEVPLTFEGFFDYFLEKYLSMPNPQIDFISDNTRYRVNRSKEELDGRSIFKLEDMDHNSINFVFNPLKLKEMEFDEVPNRNYFKNYNGLMIWNL